MHNRKNELVTKRKHMRILHIGDFHFKQKNSFEFNAIVTKLIEHLKNKPKIDYILFTGDLVFNGSIEKDFENAHVVLFDRLMNELKIASDSIFISCGNHDINWDECSKVIIAHFSNKENNVDNETLNSFCSERNKDFNSSLTASENFYSYKKEFFIKEDDSSNHLYSISVRNYEEYRIGIVAVNSAWLSSDFQPDKDNLFFPPKLIQESLEKIENCDLKIFMQHHPLHYYKEFNFKEIQNIVHQNFDIVFSGHLHKEETSVSYFGNNGIFCNTTEASLSKDCGSKIGYSIINIDLTNKSQTIKERATFIDKENTFIDLDSIVITIPCGEEKHKQNKFRQKITSKYPIELENANELLLSYNNDDQSHDFIESFTDPLISSNSDTETTGKDKETYIPIDTIFNDDNNYLIFGKDKCGKSSFLKKAQLEYLKYYFRKGIIPFYFDYKEYENKDKIDLIRIIANYFELNYNDTISLVKTGRFTFLADNLNVQSSLHQMVVDFLLTYGCRFIICSDYITSRIYSSTVLDGLVYTNLFFKNLTRKEIRLYTEKQSSVKTEDKDIVIERITNFCKQLQLPFNYWTISIILMIYKKSSDDYSKNLFGILDACVDEILLKKKLAFTKTSLTFDQYKEICSQIAYHLLTQHKETVYSSKAIDLITYIDKYKLKNPRIIGDSKDIFDFLYDTGILKRKINDLYTFRLNGIFEYFLAFYINENPKYIDELLENDSVYLAFKNELEIYSGFNRKDEEFLKKIYSKTSSVFSAIETRYKELGSIDENLCKKVGEANEFGKTIKSLIVENPISPQIQDAIKDELNPLNNNSDVHLKNYISTDIKDFELLETYISILSRVFKNSDRIKNIEMIYEIFDYLIEMYCYLGFRLIDEIEENAKIENLKLTLDELDDNIIGEEILKLISRFIPILVQSILYDGIGHINFREIILRKIEILKLDRKNNQYKLFLLYFLLIDTDIKGNKEMVDEVLENINLGVLKVSTLFKLNFYLAFKAHKNKELEQYFRNKIQTATMRLDSKTDLDELQKLLSKKQRQNIIKRSEE